MEWESKASLPDYGLDQGVAFAVNGQAYFGLGRRPDNVYSNKIWRYNPTTEIVSPVADYPGNGFVSSIAFTIGNIAYVGLGSSGAPSYLANNDFYAYDPTNNTWTQKSNFPGGPTTATGYFIIGDTAYVVGGSCGGRTCYKDELWMYVPSTNTWTQRADFPGGNRPNLTAFSIGNFGYAGNGVNSSLALSNAFWKYDPSLNTWSSIASMPGTNRRSTVNFVIDGLAYVGTGTFNWTPVINQNDFYTYNPSTNSWTHKTSNTKFSPRHSAKVAQVNDSSVFVGLGFIANGRASDIWQLKLGTDTCMFIDTTFITVQDTTRIVTYDTAFITVQDTLTFSVNTASTAQPLLVGIKVYPNPAGSQITIDIPDFTQMSSYTLKMYNTLGAEVYSQAVTSANYTISTSTLGGAGTYYLEVYDSLNAKRGRKVIIIQ